MPRKKSEKIDERLLKESVKSAYKQPRLAFYSPVSSCILNYWKSKIPRFSISEFLAEIVEKELARRWPQLYKKAEARIKSKFRSRRRSGKKG